MLNVRHSLIRIDGGTQARAALDPEVVTEYAEAIGRRERLPPPVVFYDGKDYWLADGFHRFAAHVQLGTQDIVCDVRSGTRRDAVLFSVGANASHGLRRTRADKRRAVELLLRDEEWSQWSDREIARRACVSQSFVTRLRTSNKEPGDACPAPAETGQPCTKPSDAEHRMPTAPELPTHRKVRRQGREYRMRTSTIGKKKAPPTEKPRRAREHTPADEVSAIDAVHVDVARAETTFKALVTRWARGKRLDMVFAEQRASAIKSQLGQAVEALASLRGACAEAGAKTAGDDG